MKLKTVEEYYRKFGQFPFLCIESIKEIVDDAQSDIAELQAELNDKGLWEQVVQSNKDVVGLYAPDFAVNGLKDLADRLQIENLQLRAEIDRLKSSEPCPWWAKLKKYDRFISHTGSITYFTGTIKIYSDGAVFIGGAGDRLLENEVYFVAIYCRPYTGPTIKEIKAKLTEDEWQIIEQAIKEGGK